MLSWESRLLSSRISLPPLHCLFSAIFFFVELVAICAYYFFLLFHSYVTLSRSFFSKKFGDDDIGGGLECWRGYYQSLRPTQMGLSLNIGKWSSSPKNQLVQNCTKDLFDFDLVSVLRALTERLSVCSFSMGILCVSQTQVAMLVCHCWFDIYVYFSGALHLKFSWRINMNRAIWRNQNSQLVWWHAFLKVENLPPT
jgi:hypothetical protein